MEMPVGDIKVIGFDRDGTLIDNMMQKAEAFAEAVACFYPQLKSNSAEIKQFYLETRGISRFEQLNLVAEKYGMIPLSKEKREEWSMMFTDLYMKKHADFRLFEEVPDVLGRLKKRYDLFLSTSATKEDVEKLEKKIKLSKFFKLMLGSGQGFEKGKKHFEYAADYFNVSLKGMAFIGDGPADVRMANEEGVFSIGIARNVNDKKLILAEKPNLLICNLRDLIKFL